MTNPLTVLDRAVPVSPAALKLISRGIETLWTRLVEARPLADSRPLLLSYDVHPTTDGPVLIEVNTNAGGILTAMQAARHVNACCTDWEYDVLEERLLALFRRDLLGEDKQTTGILAIVDDHLASQPLLAEMRELADLLRPHAQDVLVADAGDLDFRDGRLRYFDKPIDRVYWRSTDFLLSDPLHAAVRQAVLDGSTVLAPSPEAYQAIADKRRFVEWSKQPELARDDVTGLAFRLAETVPFGGKTVADWYAQRSQWVFKPVSGYASRGVYVGRSISRLKLATLPADAPIWLSVTHPIRSWIAMARNGNTMFASSQIVARSLVPQLEYFMAKSSECAIPVAALRQYEWARPAAWLVLLPQRRRRTKICGTYIRTIRDNVG